jgi:hypothetical protein
MHLKTKTQCTNVQQFEKVELLQYTVVGTPAKQSSAETEFRQSGRLAIRRGSENSPFGSCAQARHLVQKQVAPRFKNGALLKLQKFKNGSLLT